MSKNFILATKPVSGVQAAVFATGVVNPMERLAEVEHELSEKKISGMVLFDLLLSNGHKVNRYYIAEFNGKEFSYDRFDLANQQYETFSTLSAKILKKHFTEVNPTLLSRALQFALRKGIPV